MRFLLDTNVLSELRKKKPHGAVLAWFGSVQPEDLAIPAMVLGELQAGVEITRNLDPIKAAEIEMWIYEIALGMEVVPTDAKIAREWARIMARKNKCFSEDAMIAATARIHNWIVVTRNAKDFEQFNVQLFNPFTFQNQA